MGFCLFNNVAVAAAAGAGARARARGDRRLRRAPRQRHAGHLLRRPARPVRLVTSSRSIRARAALQRDRRGAGRGFTVNLPLPAGWATPTTCAVYREIVAARSARAFDPELVLVSAGFDAFGGDPLAGMRAHRSAAIARWPRCCLEAARRRCAAAAPSFVLEGGYDLEGLAAVRGGGDARPARRGAGHAGRGATPGGGCGCVSAFRACHARAQLRAGARGDLSRRGSAPVEACAEGGIVAWRLTVAAGRRREVIPGPPHVDGGGGWSSGCTAMTSAAGGRRGRRAGVSWPRAARGPLRAAGRARLARRAEIVARSRGTGGRSWC